MMTRMRSSTYSLACPVLVSSAGGCAPPLFFVSVSLSFCCFALLRWGRRIKEGGFDGVGVWIWNLESAGAGNQWKALLLYMTPQWGGGGDAVVVLRRWEARYPQYQSLRFLALLLDISLLLAQRIAPYHIGAYATVIPLLPSPSFPFLPSFLFEYCMPGAKRKEGRRQTDRQTNREKGNVRLLTGYSLTYTLATNHCLSFFLSFFLSFPSFPSFPSFLPSSIYLSIHLSISTSIILSRQISLSLTLT